VRRRLRGVAAPARLSRRSQLASRRIGRRPRWGQRRQPRRLMRPRPPFTHRVGPFGSESTSPGWRECGR
jgi:hypothetical protein